MSRTYAQQKRPAAKAAEPSYAAPATRTPSMVSGQSNADLDSVMQAKFQQHFLDNQIPTAEAEADRIAASVSGARTPEEVKTQLGEKMGADFSDVTFHTDSAARGMADTMGARAYTTGSDIYFGSGGFDPGVAAHELVHTVQQGMVGSTMQTTSAPTGGVQMMPKWLKKIFGKKEPAPTVTPHIVGDDPMPAMHTYANKLAMKHKEYINQVNAKPATPAMSALQVRQMADQILAPPEEEAPQAPQASNTWRMGVSPRQGYLNQIDANLSMSKDSLENNLHTTRMREAKRHIAWHNAHVGEGSMQTPYEGAFGTRVYSDDRNYKIMNSLMRTGVSPNVANGREVAPSEMKDALMASDALSRNLNEGEHTRLEEDTVVHRGAQSGYGNALANQLASREGVNGMNLADHIKDQIFTDDAFTSTSINPNKAKDFSGLNNASSPERNIVHAVLPKGLKTQFISPSSKFDEDEMLLDRNAPMRVLDAQNTTMMPTRGPQEPRLIRQIKAVYLRGLAGGHRKKKK